MGVRAVCIGLLSASCSMAEEAEVGADGSTISAEAPSAQFQVTFTNNARGRVMYARRVIVNGKSVGLKCLTLDRKWKKWKCDDKNVGKRLRRGEHRHCNNVRRGIMAWRGTYTLRHEC